MFAWLEKDRIVAPPGYQRWLVPPAALCIHLCIGMAYGFSVFWLPLTKAIGITESIVCPPNTSLWQKLITTEYDWDKPTLGWVYTLFFVFLGSSAALFGPWLERVGPRKAGVFSTCCWSGGLALSALGVYWHQLWIVWLGAGFIGGIGLGLGYISPVSTLIKWFPDRRGMATGLAIMGFGGGAMIGSPLAEKLMRFFAGPKSVGVWETFLTMAALYFVFMMLGALAYRVPAANWRPATWMTHERRGNPAAVTVVGGRFVPAQQAWRTGQFWCLWLVLCLNVSAGIGLIGMASPMLQEIFGGRLIGVDLPFDQLDKAQLQRLAAVGAGFTGLLSLFNIAGRFFWASLSDYLGRKSTYATFFLLGGLAYASVPSAGQSGRIVLFAGILGLILTMYGGAFATIPAYLADLFGTQMVGAIHGRLLTAWSVAGILGPVIVNYWNDYQVRTGVPRGAAYDQTMYILASMLVVGFLCNLLVRPVADSLFRMPDSGVGVTPRPNSSTEVVASKDPEAECGDRSSPTAAPESRLLLFAFWAVVLAPLLWGVWMTIQQAGVVLFEGRV